MNLDDLNRQIAREVDAYNNRSVAEFGGYSPNEMSKMLYAPFSEESPVRLRKLTDTGCAAVPLFNQARYLMGLVHGSGEIKLTEKGFLPRKVVMDLYGQGFMKERAIEQGITKLNKEADSDTVHLTRILLEIAGLAKKREGKLSLTKQGEKLLPDSEGLFRAVFMAFALKFNWAYFDLYGENGIGRSGLSFSLALLSRHGGEKRPVSFYAEKYFTAFPMLLASVKPEFGTLESYSTSCYSLRTFDRFLCYLGAASIEGERHTGEGIKVAKTALFDQLFECRPPQSGKKK